MTTLTRHQPHYGLHGSPYTVTSRFPGRITLSHHWTEAEALDARDAAYMAGARSVRVAGLPLRLAACGFGSRLGTLPDVADE
jgi:hypothetical protein